MMKMNEMQELLDGRFPNGAVVTFSDGEESVAEYSRITTPRLMVVTDKKIVMFSIDSRRDFILSPEDVVEEGDFVILKGASPTKTDVSLTAVSAEDEERVSRHREAFSNDRLTSMREFEG